MSAPLTNDDTLDVGATLITGFACPLIDLEIVLEIAAAVDPINTRSILLYCFQQNLTDAAK